MYEKKQLQFYADLNNCYTNKLFTFYVNDEKDCFRLMLKFAINGNVFRSAWYNHKHYIPNVKEPINIGKNLRTFVDFFNKAEYSEPPTLDEALNDYRYLYYL